MGIYKIDGSGFALPQDAKTTPLVNVYATQEAGVLRPDRGEQLINLFAPTEPFSSKAVISTVQQGPNVLFVSTTADSKAEDRNETELLDPRKALAQQLYEEWQIMIQSQLATNDPRILEQNEYAKEFVKSFLGGSKVQRDALKRELEEFSQREKKALSQGYPSTSGGRAFVRGFGRGLKNVPQRWAPFLGTYIERQTHRDEHGRVIQDGTSLNEELRTAAQGLTESLLKSAFESPEGKRVHPQVQDFTRRAHDAAHEAIKQGHEKNRAYTTLVAYQVTQQIGKPGEDMVMSIFEEIAEMQLKLEEDLRNADSQLLQWLMEAGEITAKFVVTTMSELGALLVQGTRDAAKHQSQRLSSTDRRRLPPPNDQN